MSGEIQLPHPQNLTGRNLYAIVRSVAGQPFAGTVAEAYQTAHLATYAVALTEQGAASRFYCGAFPAISAGLYTLAVYDRQGGSPAEGDPIVAFGDAQWTGTALLTGAGIAAALLDLPNGVEAGVTLRQAARIIGAAAGGKRSNVGSDTEQYDALGNPGTPRITGGLDGSGSGTPVITP